MILILVLIIVSLRTQLYTLFVFSVHLCAVWALGSVITSTCAVNADCFWSRDDVVARYHVHEDGDSEDSYGEIVTSSDDDDD